jgi:hypothetical protein
MNIGPLSSVAGAPFAQVHEAHADRAARDAALGRAHLDRQRKAGEAAGVGQPDAESLEAQDREADGRRPWERPSAEGDARGSADPSEPGAALGGRDPAQERGSRVDLCG